MRWILALAIALVSRWVCAANGMCQMHVAIRSTLFLKMRRVVCILFLVCPML